MTSHEPRPPALPDGYYPFIDQIYPLTEMQMTEAPPELEALFRAQSERNGVQLLRDVCVELVCTSKEFGETRFMIWWPISSERIHLLVPKMHVTGRA